MVEIYDKELRRKKKIDMQEREEFEKQFIKCDKCGYRNQKRYSDMSGTCNGCGATIDPLARFKYEFYKKNPKMAKKYNKKMF